MANQTGAAGPSLWAPPPASDEAADLSADTADRFPLSLQQEFLDLVDTGDAVGPFGPRYTIVGGWRLAGRLDVDTLRRALDDVVARHEALRTRIVRGEVAYQEVFPPTPVRLTVRQLPADPSTRDRLAEELVNEVEAGTFEMHEIPQLSAVLGRFDEQDAVLVLMAHHTGVDGWSMQLVVRDLAARYAARRLGRSPALPEPVQYRRYVAWQRANADAPEIRAARAFWRDTLRGAQVTPIPTARPRSEGVPPATAYYRFLLPDHLRTGTLAVAAATRGSPFMVLLAAYVMMLYRDTGEADIVAPTFTTGRRHAWVLDMVGSFYDFVPLRIDMSSCITFRDLVRQVRQTCLAAYKHEIPFLGIMREAPDLMESVATDLTTCCLLQVVQSPFIMTDQAVGDIRYTAIRRRLRSQPVGSAIPDGALWSLELHPPGIVGSVGYTTNVLDDESMVRMVADFQHLLGGVLADPDQRI